MSESDELPPDLRALLEDERARPGPSAAESDALRAGLGTLLDPGPGGGPGGGGNGAGATAAPASALAKIAAGFLAGAIAGGAVVWLAAPRTVERVVERPAPPIAAAPVAATVASAAPAPSVEAEAPVASSAAPARSAAAEARTPERRDDDLAAERALLERARAALARGDAAGALDAVDRHAARFPRGRLAEEREVLAVQALASAARVDEARARAARFHRDHPKSAFAPAVDALVR